MALHHDSPAFDSVPALFVQSSCEYGRSFVEWIPPELGPNVVWYFDSDDEAAQAAVVVGCLLQIPAVLV